MYEHFITQERAKAKADYARLLMLIDREIIDAASKGAMNTEFQFPIDTDISTIAETKMFLRNKGFTVKDANNQQDTIVIWWDGDNE